MTVAAIGLVGTGLGILAASGGRPVLARLFLTGAGFLALALFAAAPTTFGASLVAALAAIGIWVAVPPDRRHAEMLAAGACGLLCAAAGPHVAVLVGDVPLAAVQDPSLVRLMVLFAAIIAGAGVAGIGGGAFALVFCAMSQGVFDPGNPTRWLLVFAVIGVSALARYVPRIAPVALCAICLPTLLGS